MVSKGKASKNADDAYDDLWLQYCHIKDKYDKLSKEVLKASLEIQDWSYKCETASIRERMIIVIDRLKFERKV